MRTPNPADSLVSVRLTHVSFAGVLAALWWVQAFGAPAQAPAPAWPPAPPAIASESLASGVRVIYLPEVPGALSDDVTPRAPSDVVVAAGFAVAGPDSPDERTAHELVSEWLLASVPARTSELIAHLSGGSFEALDHTADLVGFRVRVPESVVDAVVEQATLFLDQTLSDGELLGYVLSVREDDPSGERPDASDRATMAVRSVLLEDTSADEAIRDDGPVSVPASAPVVAYFRSDFGTDRARVILSARPTAGQLERLSDIEERRSPAVVSAAEEIRFQGEAALTLPSQPEGGLVVGSRIASVYYEGWFNTLVVDRAMRRVLGPRARLSFGPSRRSATHLVETSVQFPDYPEDIAAAIVQEFGMLGTDDPSVPSLPEIKQDALSYLADRAVLEWFVAHDLSQPLKDGWARVWNLTQEEFRSSVAAFLTEPRVTATWAPAFDSPEVFVGGLGTGVDVEEAPRPLRRAPGEIVVPVIGIVQVPDREPVRVERLSSGAALAMGSPGIFVAGPRGPDLPGGDPDVGRNGTLWAFADVPGEAVFRALGDVRPDRLLLFSSAREAEQLRAVLGEWSGGRTDATDSTSVGDVATIDLPALVILKVWLERKVIEAGWSGEVRIRIAGTEGSSLSFDADPLRQAEIDRWLASASEAFEAEDGEAEFRQLRASAGAYFDEIRRELQILLWQRAPDGEIPPPETVSLARFRNFLGAYF